MSRGGGGNRPIPGRQYVVNQDGDLDEMATQAYGDPGGSAKIWGANRPRKSKSVKRGEVFIIPGEKPADQLTGKAPEDFTVIIGGVEVPIMSGRIVRTMDTGADGWSGKIAWEPGQYREIDRVTRPYGYERTAAYLGNELQVAGCLYTVSPEMDHSGLSKELIGYSFTVDAIDSSMLPPYQSENITLKQLANELCGPLGIKAVFEADFGGAFTRTCADEGEKIFEHLAKLAAQRGGLVSNTRQGDMLFHRAKTEQVPVGTLEESQPLVMGWKAVYDGRKRYHAYKCITQGLKGRSTAPEIWGSTPTGPAVKRSPPSVTALDTGCPRPRWLTFKADDVTQGNVKNAANWKRNRHFIDALTLPFPVSSWYAPNGKLWDTNTLVTIVSRTLGVPRGFTFLIRHVEFEFDHKGRTAMLYVVPPEAYSGKDIGEIWTLE